ncbi:MAG: ABC transporter ATP-binding protein [Bacteroidia bacterium]|nr:ABC transporter ATP-binding protein [Bacteroidia bacterium]
MIKIDNLTKIYGSATVLDIPQLEIQTGESFGLVGNNGAGKTTMFRCLLDLIRPNSGTVLSRGSNVANSESWKEYTGSYLDDGFLIDFLTPEEYFTFVADVYGLKEGDKSAFFTDFDEFFNNEILNKKKLIRDFSSGNRQRIGIAGALMPQPEVLILDEPFNSLDPTTQIRLKNMIRKLKEEKGVTILISSHDLNHITEVCDRIVVLHEGKAVHDLKTNQDTLKVLEEYFAVR